MGGAAADIAFKDVAGDGDESLPCFCFLARLRSVKRLNMYTMFITLMSLMVNRTVALNKKYCTF